MASNGDIPALEARQREVLDELAPAADEFVGAAAEFAAEHYQRTVEGAVTANPALAKEKGPAGLKPLKDAMNDLIGRAPDLAKHHLDVDELWFHRKDADELAAAIEPRSRFQSSEYRMRGLRAPKAIDDRVRLLIGEVGGILRDHGFLDPDPSYESSDSGWRYRYAFDWSDAMRAKIDAYAEHHEELRMVTGALADARREKESGQARDLWESI